MVVTTENPSTCTRKQTYLFLHTQHFAFINTAFYLILITIIQILQQLSAVKLKCNCSCNYISENLVHLIMSLSDYLWIDSLHCYLSSGEHLHLYFPYLNDEQSGRDVLAYDFFALLINDLNSHWIGHWSWKRQNHSYLHICWFISSNSIDLEVSSVFSD